MLTKIDSTFGSLSMILNAATTCSSVALPPTSKKLAGFPPFIWMRSIVAMASPAPLTIHPILPSRAMQLRSCLSAQTSFQFFCEMSSIINSYFCRQPELSSMLILQSQIFRFPSMSTPKGFIQISVASFSRKNLYSFWMIARRSLPSSYGSSYAVTICSRVYEGTFDEGGKKYLNTLFDYTSSMFIPPFGEATMAIDPDPRSRRIDKYSYFLRKIFYTIKTSLHILPV